MENSEQSKNSNWMWIADITVLLIFTYGAIRLAEFFNDAFNSWAFSDSVFRALMYVILTTYYFVYLLVNYLVAERKHLPDERSGFFRYIVDSFRVLIAVIPLVILLSRVLLFGMIIPEVALSPTLMDGDHVFFSPVPYGISLPARGDIAIIKKQTFGNDEWHIRRIIGLPGESVELQNGKIIIDNQPLFEPYISEYASHLNISPQVLKSDEYMTMADRRESFMDRPMVATHSDLIGLALFRIAPLPRIGILPTVEYTRSIPSISEPSNTSLTLNQQTIENSELTTTVAPLNPTNTPDMSSDDELLTNTQPQVDGDQRANVPSDVNGGRSFLLVVTIIFLVSILLSGPRQTWQLLKKVLFNRK